MPTYEYECRACKHNFDEFQGINDAPLKKCPKCGKAKLRRVYGAGAAVIFKGSGFYQTDYRSESYKAAAKKETESSGKPAGEAGSNGAAAKPDAAGKADMAKSAGGGKSSGKSAKSKG